MCIELFEFDGRRESPAGLFHFCLVVAGCARGRPSGSPLGRPADAREVWQIFTGEPYLHVLLRGPVRHHVELYSHSHERTYANR